MEILLAPKKHEEKIHKEKEHHLTYIHIDYGK